VTVEDVFDADRTSARIRGLTGLQAESWMETNAQLMNALTSQSMSTNMISFFVAISVALGIASVLAVSVAQRTREIGILRAMGTRRRQMLQVFLVQGAVLGLIGSAIGAFAGWGLAVSFNSFGPKLFTIDLPPSLVPAAMALATLAGLGAALVPAWRASRLRPVAADPHAEVARGPAPGRAAQVLQHRPADRGRGAARRRPAPGQRRLRGTGRSLRFGQEHPAQPRRPA